MLNLSNHGAKQDIETSSKLGGGGEVAGGQSLILDHEISIIVGVQKLSEVGDMLTVIRSVLCTACGNF
jgi:hypothetical protein